MAPTESRRIRLLYGDLGVVAHETTTLGDESGLWAGEKAAMHGSSSKRRGQFAAGRRCARAGFVALGLAPQAILPGPDRRPLWPRDAEGSISHTDGLCVAVVAETSELAGRGIGVDVERRGRVGPNLFTKLFTAAEIGALDEMTEMDRALAATAGFSAKEAFYKAQYPITRAWVSFTDVELAFSPSHPLSSSVATIVARPATDLKALDEVHWPIEIGVDVRHDLIVTAAVARPTGHRRPGSSHPDGVGA